MSRKTFEKSHLSTALALAFGASVMLVGAAQAQEALQRVEITGSSIKRVAAEGALPVTTVTRAEIENSGVQSVEELLAQVTAVSSAGGQVNAGQSGLATYGRSAVSLRGIGSDKTLVLVNGRRLALFAGGGSDVNVNAIPLGAIERVEVLTDGASGVYGSDAIAGVVNFIMRKDYKGFEISAETGTPTRSGGGKNNKVGVVAGFGDYNKSGWSATISGSMEKETNLLGADRDFANTDTREPFFAGGATETGRIEGTWNFPGGATLTGAGTNARSATNPFGISGTGYGNPSAVGGNCASIGMVSRSGKGWSGPFVQGPDGDIQTKTTPNCTFDTGNFVSLVPNREFKGLTGNVRFKVNETNELFADVLYARNEFTNPIQPAPLRQAFYAGNPTFAGSGVDPALLIYPSNPNYKFAADYLTANGLGAMVGQPLAVSQRTFLLGSRTSNDIATQDRIVVGGKGSVGSLDYDFAYMRNNSVTEGGVIDGFASIFELSKVLNNPANQWNPWAPGGVQTPEITAKINATKYRGPTISSKSTNDGMDAKVSGTIMEMAGGPMGFAAGVQARDESYVLTPAPATLTGDVIGLGGAITPVDAKRTVWAMFAETSLPVTKELEGSFAVRRDSYSDFGTTTNWKASGRYQPSASFLARGSVGTGFKAPSLVNLFTPVQINTTEQFTDPKFPGNGQIQVTSIAGGNPLLTPEKSNQFSLGLVFSPVKTVTASVDYFNIEIKDAIFTPSAQQLVSAFRAGRAGYAALVELDAGGEVSLVRQTVANNSSVKTNGLDIDVKYREKMGGGRLDIGLAGTYTLAYDLVNAAQDLEKSVGTTVREDGTPLVASPTGVILKWKHNLNVGYTSGQWSATVTQRYYQGYEDAPDLNGDRHFVPNTAVYDLVTTYSPTKSMKFALGVRNLFDSNPPLFINNGSQFQSGYDVYQYDPRGRFVYLTGNYKF